LHPPGPAAGRQRIGNDNQILDTAIMGPEDYLFSSNDWFSLEQHLAAELRKEVATLDADRLLNTAPDAMCRYFEEKFTLDLPVIRTEDISFEQREANIDISRRHDYGFDGYGPCHVRGIEYEFHIPFSGDPNLLRTRPTSFTSVIPRAQIRERERVLVHYVRNVQLSNEQVEASVDGLVREINQYLGWLGASTTQWNNQLAGQVRSLVESRREKLIAERTSASNLKFKIRDRPGAARTYVAPEVRRKVTPTLPPASSAAWKSEPVLDMAQYDHILKIITDAALTMERSPAAFSTMGEEDLRTQFLFQLNGHFEGQATGETFNKEGKTDILIRSEGKNIFIGECKFWGGQKVLAATIDQLLGYASWRDTKVAIIIFNRNKNFSAVLDQIRPTVESHPNCKRFVSKLLDTQFRFIFTQRDDPSREMTLTVMAFDVPQP
jgi:hypothetical protein